MPFLKLSVSNEHCIRDQEQREDTCVWLGQTSDKLLSNNVLGLPFMQMLTRGVLSS